METDKLLSSVFTVNHIWRLRNFHFTSLNIVTCHSTYQAGEIFVLLIQQMILAACKSENVNLYMWKQLNDNLVKSNIRIMNYIDSEHIYFSKIKSNI